MLTATTCLWLWCRQNNKTLSGCPHRLTSYRRQFSTITNYVMTLQVLRVPRCKIDWSWTGWVNQPSDGHIQPDIHMCHTHTLTNAPLSIPLHTLFTVKVRHIWNCIILMKSFKIKWNKFSEDVLLCITSTPQPFWPLISPLISQWYYSSNICVKIWMHSKECLNWVN